jgi:hypothetical protein
MAAPVLLETIGFDLECEADPAHVMPPLRRLEVVIVSQNKVPPLAARRSADLRAQALARSAGT